MYGMLQWGCTWYALFFRSGASQCTRYTRAALGEAAQCTQCQRQQLCPAFSTKPDSTHAFCVRVRFKLCKTQAVAEPSGGLARGASRPSRRVPHRFNTGQRNAEPSAGSGATAHRRRRIPRRAWIPRRETTRAALRTLETAPQEAAMGAGASAARDEEVRQLRAERDELRNELRETRRKLDEAAPHPPRRARSGLISPTRAHRSSDLASRCAHEP